MNFIFCQLKNSKNIKSKFENWEKSASPSSNPSKSPSINECSVLLFAQYRRDYDECIQFTETYQAFPTTYSPITWGMRCFCFREIANALADDPTSVEDQEELQCRIKKWEELNLLELFYDCYGEGTIVTNFIQMYRLIETFPMEVTA